MKNFTLFGYFNNDYPILSVWRNDENIRWGRRSGGVINNFVSDYKLIQNDKVLNAFSAYFLMLCLSKFSLVIKSPLSYLSFQAILFCLELSF